MSGMTWKKRAGQAMLKRPLAAAFAGSDSDSDGEETESAGLQPATKSAHSAEPALSAAEQAAALREQGAALAELGRYWEALTLWDQAVELTPLVAALHEMRAQALLAVQELWPALTAAARAVQLQPRWWEAHQTLGRTLLGLGELGLARRSFSVAAHLQPADEPLRTDDLLWSCVLLERARRRHRRGDSGTDEEKATPQLSSAGGIVTEEQSERVRTLLGLGGHVSVAPARCHDDWGPLAEDALEEAEETRRREDASDEEVAEMDVDEDYPFCPQRCGRLP